MPYPDPNHFKTPLKRARSTGSAHTGAHEWLEGRASSAMLIPLALWLFWEIVTMAKTGMSFGDAVAWVQKPYHGFPLILFCVVFFWHASIAGKDVIVDYVSGHKRQVIGLQAFRVFCMGLMLLSVFSVLYITFKM